MNSLQDIIFVLNKNREKLYSTYPISSFAIFGSIARNEQTDDSDIDIMVEFHDNIGIRFIDLANELEILLGMKVDLVSKTGIKKRYLQSIEEDLIYV